MQKRSASVSATLRSSCDERRTNAATTTFGSRLSTLARRDASEAARAVEREVMTHRILRGPQNEIIVVPVSLDDDADLQPTTEYGRKLLQKLQQDYKPELVGNISGQSFPESASLTNQYGVNPSAVLCEAYAVAGAEGLLTDGWTILLDDDPVNAGTCTESTKTIKLSPRWMTSVAESRDTYLHEIAHALQTLHHGTAHNACLHELRHKHNRID
jgi:hypothetical protein